MMLNEPPQPPDLLFPDIMFEMPDCQIDNDRQNNER